MKTVINPEQATWADLLKRPAMEAANLDQLVQGVLAEVGKRGDAAVRAYTARFDGVALDSFQVTEAEFAEAERLVDEPLKEAIQLARQNIESFHSRQWEQLEEVETMPGVRCWRKSVPIDKVGLYIPGGTAPLFSSVLMLGVPARIAGCGEIVLCTPPDKSGKVNAAILYTAAQVGIGKVFKIGGAQAIAAMAQGTETVPAVYKIFGPGNQYVTAAKQLASRRGVAIDMPAGPSEVLVLADATAQPAFVAADLLSQAEHGIDSQVVLVADSLETAAKVQEAVMAQLESLPRRAIAAKALANSVAVVMEDRSAAIRLINGYAPEHLILAVDDARAVGEEITNAGSVFLGHYTPESVGDYASGTNHTLPTDGYARSYSGVSLDSFIKKITFQELTPQGLQQLGPAVQRMAEAEQLSAHARAVAVRLNAE
ncbi:histidinol dehydrogenase [Phaeodactylibacter luteus]|uniref:Histidinol dehydrogenase n=1 Tax=Phaeodactylibacter luteus TaxID=1564516 RepID=A0A5C6RY96_9BACT|nr:histidinol dehydrogenase [Phaeodactylibacter luteus]TXB66342.1 histidinol dehydrogenase [Phaeodactylibacter luteus]